MMATLQKIYNLYTELETVSTDTRLIKHGSMFFALKGPNFNGNAFAHQALANGAAYCVVDEPQGAVDPDRCFLVPDVLQTLQQLAIYHRNHVGLRNVIAIGGSNGKTTTKELIGAVLAKRYKTFHTEGNLNNHIGVPLSLLSIKKETETAVIELGANHIGETLALCNICMPDCGLVTNNGKDHLEGYGSLDGVRKGNGELFEYLKLTNGTAFASTMQPDLMQQSETLKRYTYGDKNANVIGRIISAAPHLVVNFKEDSSDKSYDVETKLTGSYNFENVMAAVAVGLFFGVLEDDIASALEKYKPANNRSQWLERKDNDFIVDCYNANPSSMQLAIENLAALHIKDKKKMAVLGDMFELGSFSDAEHENMLQLAASKNFDELIVVGQAFRKANAAVDATDLTFRNVQELRHWFEKEKPKDFVVLLKGSRGMTLEKVLEE